MQLHCTAYICNIHYHSNASWQSWLNPWNSFLASQNFKTFEFWDLRIKDWELRNNEFLKRKIKKKSEKTILPRWIIAVQMLSCHTSMTIFLWIAFLTTLGNIWTISLKLKSNLSGLCVIFFWNRTVMLTSHILTHCDLSYMYLYITCKLCLII